MSSGRKRQVLTVLRKISSNRDYAGEPEAEVERGRCAESGSEHREGSRAEAQAHGRRACSFQQIHAVSRYRASIAACVRELGLWPCAWRCPLVATAPEARPARPTPRVP